MLKNFISVGLEYRVLAYNAFKTNLYSYYRIISYYGSVLHSTN